jgi:hypothetical protein
VAAALRDVGVVVDSRWRQEHRHRIIITTTINNNGTSSSSNHFRYGAARCCARSDDCVIGQLMMFCCCCGSTAAAAAATSTTSYSGFKIWRSIPAGQPACNHATRVPALLKQARAATAHRDCRPAAAAAALHSALLKLLLRSIPSATRALPLCAAFTSGDLRPPPRCSCFFGSPSMKHRNP